MSTDGHGAIVVYDRHRNEAWRVLDGHSALSAETTVIFIERKRVPLNGGVDGIALTPDGAWLYWKALAGRTLYRIRTDVLRNRQLADADRAAAIENLGMRRSPTACSRMLVAMSISPPSNSSR